LDPIELQRGEKKRNKHKKQTRMDGCPESGIGGPTHPSDPTGFFGTQWGQENIEMDGKKYSGAKKRKETDRERIFCCAWRKKILC
jgi:hypothetical protein